MIPGKREGNPIAGEAEKTKTIQARFQKKVQTQRHETMKKANNVKFDMLQTLHYKPKPRRGQTAIEYVMMISATVVFITLVAYFVKNKVVAP